LIKLLRYNLFEKYVYILSLEMASPGNRHCANCIGSISFPIFVVRQTLSPESVVNIVDTCPLTTSAGGLNLLHEADDDAVIWLVFAK